MEGLNGFEELLADKISDTYLLDLSESRAILHKYLLVIRAIRLINRGSESLDETAKLCYESYINDTSPSVWLNQIYSTRRDMDPTIEGIPQKMPFLKKMYVLQLSMYNFDKVSFSVESAHEVEPSEADIIIACQKLRETYGPYRTTAEIVIRYEFGEKVF